MIPIGDDNTSTSTPYTTICLIGLSLIIWTFVQGMGREASLIDSLCRFGLVPGWVLYPPPPATVVGWERGYCGHTSGWYASITSMFIHGGWFHVAGNLWFLWIFGRCVEASMGHVRFAAFYLLCGIIAAVVVQATATAQSYVVLVGASGAVGGVVMAYVLLYPSARVHTVLLPGVLKVKVVLPAFAILGCWLVIQMINGLQLTPSLGQSLSPIQWWAIRMINGGIAGVPLSVHIGGLGAGALLVLLLRHRRRRSLSTRS